MAAYKPGISSMSLGRAWVHDLDYKIEQACRQGFKGIELFYEDLEYVAKGLPGGLTDGNRIEAAHQIHKMCKDPFRNRNIDIIGLQPFMHYEGLRDRTQHASRIEKLKLWFQLIKILDTDIIQIPSNFLKSEEITDDFDTIVKDLREVADLGLQETPQVRFAYENLCWGTYVDTWSAAWKIIAAVDRPNFGMCLDTFNIAGREWADPASPDGKVPNADAILKASLVKMRKTIDIKKIFYVQVVDAERLRNALTPEHAFHVDGQPPRMSWSRNARLFAFEEPGYLPILDVLHAITDEDGLKFKGWISMELFSRTMADPKKEVPRQHAERGMRSWKKLVEVMGWKKTSG
ncbi:MAG: hypothetical protein M1834_001312 [Cirrosporium novae-zelandiae]|nr:MAG: hypothetical protein M1834_001312 [Cirrosporium novae-zelandiae]